MTLAPDASAVATDDDDDVDAQRTDEQWLVEFVADRDVACPACAYNLRQLTSSRCPECGLNLRLTLRPAEPAARAWVTLMTLLCAAAGVGLLFIFMIARRGWSQFVDRRHPFVGEAVVQFHLCAIPLACLALWLRRPFQRLSRAVQWWITITAAAVLAAAFWGSSVWMK